MKKLLTILKWIGYAFGAYVLVFGGYFYYSLSTAEARVKPFCDQIKAGTTMADLKALASDNGMSLSMSSDKARPVYLRERRSYGRYGCDVSFEADSVKSSTYSFMD